MNDWLTIELVFVTLLVTTFTCVGILALWAATSPRHWFIRTALAFLVLSPLLLVPAFGPFLTFSLVVSFVAIGVAVSRLWRRRINSKSAELAARESQRTSPWQISIKSALAISACVSVLTAIIVRIPDETWEWWPVFVLSAVIAVLITLFAAWVVNGESSQRSRTACAIAFVATVLACTVLNARYAYIDLPMVSMAMSGYFSISENQIKPLFAVAPGLFLALVVTLALATSPRRESQNALGKNRRKWRRIAMLLWSLILLAPPALTLSALLQPLPAIDTSLPNPNGYDELVAIGKRFDGSDIMKEIAADVVDESKLDAAVPRYDAEFIAIRKALDLPFRIPVQFDQWADMDPDSFGALRRLSDLLDAKAGASLRAGSIEESLACRRDTLRLSQSISNSGLLVHYLIASAIEGSATCGIYESVGALNPRQCRTFLNELTELESNRAPFAAIRERELTWMVKTSGWPNRLGYFFERLTADGTVNDCESSIYPRDQAIMRLLLMELALNAYRLDHGRPPAELSELVPGYLVSLADDPFAAARQPFRYTLSGSGFVLWSMGPDGDDDGGVPLPKNEYGGHDLEANGDLRLDVYFSPAE